MNKEDTDSQAWLVIIRGLPGSGKSYIAQKLEALIGKEKTLILDPDDIDFTSREYINFSAELTRTNVDSILHPYRFLRANAYAGIETGKLVVWNQAFTNQDLVHRTIVNLQAHADEKSVKLHCLVVDVIVDPQLAKVRVESRVNAGGHTVNSDEFERFIRDYQPFHGYDYSMLTLSGESSVEESALKILEKVELKY